MVNMGSGKDSVKLNGGAIGKNFTTNAGTGTNTFKASDGTVGGKLSYTAGTGKNTVTISKQVSNYLNIRLAGGNSTVSFAGISNFTGNATVDFGVGVGPKTYLPPVMVTGKIQVLNP